MEPLQPLQESIGFLAGSPVPRSTRPGECFPAPEEAPTPAVQTTRSTRRTVFLTLAAAILMRLRISP